MEFIQITGEGLHRNLIVSTQLESNERFIECRILYNLKVPKGMYVDSDRLAIFVIVFTVVVFIFSLIFHSFMYFQCELIASSPFPSLPPLL